MPSNLTAKNITNISTKKTSLRHTITLYPNKFYHIQTTSMTMCLLTVLSYHSSLMNYLCRFLISITIFPALQSLPGLRQIFVSLCIHLSLLKVLAYLY